jgi:hypothetical protein
VKGNRGEERRKAKEKERNNQTDKHGEKRENERKKGRIA